MSVAIWPRDWLGNLESPLRSLVGKETTRAFLNLTGYFSEHQISPLQRNCELHPIQTQTLLNPIYATTLLESLDLLVPGACCFSTSKAVIVLTSWLLTIAWQMTSSKALDSLLQRCFRKIRPRYNCHLSKLRIPAWRQELAESLDTCGSRQPVQ